MGGERGVVVALVMMVAMMATMLNVVRAGQHVVQWTPQSYQDMNVSVGDSIGFKFERGKYNVMEVSQSDYATCTTTPIGTIYTSGLGAYRFTGAGTHYFICGIPPHCKTGQMKITVNVI
ncbi:early nodulin-like protein [Striga asiatica]|uniref:Early nodulin-like protein n=1 Tax=Striga asiatica TaxID=4170 RepID=A0A5A7QSK5_STRAF|nr:early nodulin-like protein [Striga asiatica]